MSKTIDIIARAMAAKGGQSENVSDIKVDGRSIVKPDGTAELATESPYDPDTNPLATMNDVGGGSVDSLIEETTWAQLKTKRDAGELTPGMKYRITNYECTTAQSDTRSAGHPFDIIVTAITNRELSEEASADYHVGDTYFKGVGEADFIPDLDIETVTTEVQILHGVESSYHKSRGFTDYGKDNNGNLWIAYDGGDFFDKYIYQGRADYDGITYDLWRCTVEPNNEKLSYTNIITQTTEVVHSNLLAWQLKYCLDNDSNRFAWAQPGDDIKAIKVKQGISATYIYVRYPSEDYTEQTPKGPILWQAWAYVNGSDDLDFDDPTYDYSDIDTSDIIWYSGYTAGESKDRDGGYTYLAMRNPTPAGKGVIYYMKDEHGNECPYDFKNIQFKRYCCSRVDDSVINDFNGEFYGTIRVSTPQEDMEYNTYPSGYNIPDITDFTWYYTFDGCDLNEGEHYDVSTISRKFSASTIQDMIDDGSGGDILDTCHGNIIKPLTLEYMCDEDYELGKQWLNDIVLLSTYDEEDWSAGKIHENIFEMNCRNITLGSNGCNNHLGISTYGAAMGNTCLNNQIGLGSTYGYAINIGSNCYNLNLYRVSNANIGFNCNLITAFGWCDSLSTGTYCSRIFMSNASIVKMGDSCNSISIGEYSNGITLGNSCNNITIGSRSSSIQIADNSDCITIGNFCQMIYFATSYTFTNPTTWCQKIAIGNDNQRLLITASGTASSNNKLQNIYIHPNINKTNTFKTITPARNLSYNTEYVAQDTQEFII